MLQVLNIVLQYEPFQTFEWEPDLLVVGEALKGFKILVDGTLHKFVDFLL